MSTNTDLDGFSKLLIVTFVVVFGLFVPLSIYDYMVTQHTQNLKEINNQYDLNILMHISGQSRENYFKDKTFKNIIFDDEHSKLYNLNFTDVIFDNVEFNNITLRGITFINCKFHSIKFFNCNINDIVFKYGEMVDSEFSLCGFGPNIKRYEFTMNNIKMIDNTPENIFAKEPKTINVLETFNENENIVLPKTDEPENKNLNTFEIHGDVNDIIINN